MIVKSIGGSLVPLVVLTMFCFILLDVFSEVLTKEADLLRWMWKILSQRKGMVALFLWGILCLFRVQEEERRRCVDHPQKFMFSLVPSRVKKIFRTPRCPFSHVIPNLWVSHVQQGQTKFLPFVLFFFHVKIFT